MKLLGFAFVLILFSLISIGTGFNDHDFGRVAAGTFFYLLPAIGIIVFKFRDEIFDTSGKELRQLQHEEALRIADELAVADSQRPDMKPPKKGAISAAYKRIDKAVYVWVELTERDKQTLVAADLLDTSIDEVEDKKAIDARVADYGEILEETTDRINIKSGVGEKYQLTLSAKERNAAMRKYRKEIIEQNQVTLRDILSNPYRRPVANATEAAVFIDALKTRILPNLKEIVKTHESPLTGSIEL